jgi:hypothetical protein
VTKLRRLKFSAMTNQHTIAAGVPVARVWADPAAVPVSNFWSEEPLPSAVAAAPLVNDAVGG